MDTKGQGRIIHCMTHCITGSRASDCSAGETNVSQQVGLKIWGQMSVGVKCQTSIGVKRQLVLQVSRVLFWLVRKI